MFTGIIESMGTIKEVVHEEGGNVTFSVASFFTDELIPGQSIAHNGVCLTVTSVDLDNQCYKVTAIDETLKRSNIGLLQPGDEVNLERCLAANGRFDGHIVQGHVDTMATCQEIVALEGSWIFTFSHPVQAGNLTVEKGSVCVNGISFTVAASEKDNFKIAVIPYTYQHTNIKNLQKEMKVNIEFDIIGKYLYKMQQNLS